MQFGVELRVGLNVALSIDLPEQVFPLVAYMAKPAGELPYDV